MWTEKLVQQKSPRKTIQSWRRNINVLIKGNKLQFAWIGLYTVVSTMNDVNYILQREDEGCKIVHVNMLDPYCRKENWDLYTVKEDPEEKQKLLCKGHTGT